MNKDARKIIVVSFDGCLASTDGDGNFQVNEPVAAVMRNERECNPPTIFIVRSRKDASGTVHPSSMDDKHLRVSMLMEEWDLRFAFVDIYPEMVRDALGPGVECTITQWTDMADVYHAISRGLCRAYVGMCQAPSAFAGALLARLKEVAETLESTVVASGDTSASSRLDGLVQSLADLEWDLCNFEQSFGISDRVNAARRKKITAIENVMSLYKVFAEEETK